MNLFVDLIVVLRQKMFIALEVPGERIIFLMTLTHSTDVRYFSDDFNAQHWRTVFFWLLKRTAVMYGIFLMTLTHSYVRYFLMTLMHSYVRYFLITLTHSYVRYFLMTLTRSSDARYFSDDFNAQWCTVFFWWLQRTAMYGIFLTILTHSDVRYFSDDFIAQWCTITLTHSDVRYSVP